MPRLERIQVDRQGAPSTDEFNRLQTAIERALGNLRQEININFVPLPPAVPPGTPTGPFAAAVRCDGIQIGATRLINVDASTFIEGTFCWVHSVGTPFVLEQTGGLTVDNITVVTAFNRPTYVWRRIDGVSGYWWQQGTWFIGGTGANDENTGAAGFPLATFAELRRRMIGRHLLLGATNDFTVNLQGDLGDTDYMQLDFQPNVIATNVTVIGTPTVTAIGTVASATAHNFAANQATEIVVTGFNWAPWVGKLIRRQGTTGLTSETAIVAADLGAGRARLTLTNSNLAQGTDITTGDIVEGLTLPRAPGALVRFVGTMLVYLVNIDPTTGGARLGTLNGGMIIIASTLKGATGTTFSILGASLITRGCGFSTRSMACTGNWSADRSLFSNVPITLATGRLGRNEWQDSMFTGTTTFTLGEGEYLRFHSLGVYNLPTNGSSVVMSNGAYVTFTDVIYGTGNGAGSNIFNFEARNNVETSGSSATFQADTAHVAVIQISLATIDVSGVPYYRDTYGNEIMLAKNVDATKNLAVGGRDLSATSYPFTDVVGLLETGGPTHLLYGAIPDLSLFQRSGTAVVGVLASSFAPSNAHYVTTQAEAGLSNEFNLGALAAGILGHTVAAGVSTPIRIVESTGLTLASPNLTVNLSTGIAGGQSAIGGTAASENLTLSSTTNGTKGKTIFGSTSGMFYDESTGQLAVGATGGTVDAGAAVQLTKNQNGITRLYVSNSSAGASAYSNITVGQNQANAFALAEIGIYLSGSGNTGVYGANAGIIELYGGLGGTNGDFILSVVESTGGYKWKTGLGVTNRMSLSNAGVLAIDGLSAGGLVKATAATGALTIAVANTDYLAVPAFTNGSVIYWSSGLAQDNAGLFYDAANRVLALGTNSTTAGQKIKIAGDVSLASSAGLAWDPLHVAGGTLTLTGTTTVDSLRAARFTAPTITDGSAVTVTKAATVSIAGAPTAAGSVTIGTALALDIESGAWAHHNATGTDYERVRAAWVASVWTLKSEKGGGGLVRDMKIDADTSALTLAGITVTAGGTSSTTIGVAGTTPIVVIQDPGAGFSKQVYVDSSQTVASSASLVWRGFEVWPATLTLTGSTNVTTAEGLNSVWIDSPTINGNGVAKTITNAATVAIHGPPVGTSSATITNAYSFWVQSGTVRTDGGITPGGGAASTLANIGGSGPTTAAQFKWIPWSVDGQAGFIPFWK
jgi:hypothetical protein